MSSSKHPELRDWYPLESSPEVFTQISRKPKVCASETCRGVDRHLPSSTDLSIPWDVPRLDVLASPVSLSLRIAITEEESITAKWQEWGLDSQYTWMDVFGLDDASLDAFAAQIPAAPEGKVHAIVLLFPDTPEIVALRKSEGPCLDVKEGEEVLWIPQIDVGHACGTFAMLHSFSVNRLAPNLEPFFTQCRSVPPEDRPLLVAQSPLIRDAHNGAVRSGQTEIRESDWEDCDHFISFVLANINGEGRLLEMDGVPPRSGPLDRGVCTDLLRDTAKVVREVYLPRAGDNAHFSMMALVG